MEQRPAPRARQQRPKRHRWFLISSIAIIVLCAVGGLLLSTLFAGATVTVYPKEEPVNSVEALTAKLHPATGELGFQVLTITRSASTTVPATGTQQASRSASGVITIYNEYSTDNQRLIARTRFEAPDGKIYRIQDSVVVPGATKNADGTLAPGATTATAYADSPGDSYNKGETRFTLPGFKGDPQYDKIYATAASMEGGFVGQEPAIAKADLDKATDALKQGLAQAAQASLTSQIPEGYMAVPGTLQVSYSSITQTPGQGNTAVVGQSATMSGAVVLTGGLAAAIAKSSVQGYAGEPVGFKDTSAFTIAAATTTKAGDDISITISGSPTLVWQYDAAALKAALVGKSKSTFDGIIQSFEPAITRAEAKVRPFWEGSFPSNPDKIELTTATP
jgi:hypothetical protein